MSLNNYQSNFDKLLEHHKGSSNFNLGREKAFARFIKMGFPNKKMEGWRFTDFSSLINTNYKIQLEEKNKGNFDSSFLENELDGVDTLVFYNGHYQKDLSSIPKKTKITYKSHQRKEIFSHSKISEQTPFDLLNKAFSSKSFSLEVKPNINLEKPIRLLFISSGKNSTMSNPRIFLKIGSSSSATLLEHHVGDAKNFFQNCSMFTLLEKNAGLDYIKVQKNSAKTKNVFNYNVDQGKDSFFSFSQFLQGSQLTRTNLNVKLNDENASCSISSLSLTDEKRHNDDFIVVNHKHSNCNSSQLFKNILQDQSSGVFTGKTIVSKQAQKTDSSQYNKNLLLSKSSHMNSNPQLEIHADDVKCSHGSTTGELDLDALFYLRSRGLNSRQATSLLVRGFAEECFNKIKIKTLSLHIKNIFNGWIKEKGLN
tara:strand:- start:114416 stop:115687 length:1272 start_codon:yes stop_codon:yes gene_type:complete